MLGDCAAGAAAGVSLGDCAVSPGFTSGDCATSGAALSIFTLVRCSPASTNSAWIR